MAPRTRGAPYLVWTILVTPCYFRRLSTMRTGPAPVPATEVMTVPLAHPVNARTWTGTR
jgi:hypothetical protein